MPNVFNLVSETNYESKMTSVISAINSIASSMGVDAIRNVDYANNTLSFYKKADKSDTPITVNLPEEMFLDQTKTTIVNNFVWSSATYPGSTNPQLDGEVVLVLAVKGDSSVSYSFVALPDIITVDSALSDSSTNPVQNKVIKSALDSKVTVVSGKGLSTNDFDATYKGKLDNVDTTVTASSSNLVTSGAVSTALSGKVDVVSGKGLSTNDYTTTEKTKLSGLDNAIMECEDVTNDTTHTIRFQLYNGKPRLVVD